jgi:hypothetical protein
MKLLCHFNGTNYNHQKKQEELQFYLIMSNGISEQTEKYFIIL